MSLLRPPLFALFAPMLSVQCLAQVRTGPISGSVYEEQRQGTYRRQALVGALVEVQAPTDTLHTTTDYNGNFHLRVVPSGEVRVKVAIWATRPSSATRCISLRVSVLHNRCVSVWNRSRKRSRRWS